MLENEIYEWLKERQVNVPQYKVFGLKEELDADAYPVALKIQSPNIVHKTEAGGVALNLGNKEALNKAGDGIQPGDHQQFLVSRMYNDLELFFGIVHDPVFEKVIVFSAGGIFTDLFKEVCFIDSEADEKEIFNAIAQTRIGTLFTRGFSGKKYDIHIIIDFVKELQLLDAKELDLNPVMLQNDTLAVVDACLLPGIQSFEQKKNKIFT